MYYHHKNTDPTLGVKKFPGREKNASAGDPNYLYTLTIILLINMASTYKIFEGPKEEVSFLCHKTRQIILQTKWD